jgi:predicted ATPase
MIHLRSIGLKPAARRLEGFPFELPVVRKFRELKLRSPVTFLVGENGSGKSTVLEGLAAAVGSVVVGGEDVRADKTLGHSRRSLDSLGRSGRTAASSSAPRTSSTSRGASTRPRPSWRRWPTSSSATG